MNEDILKGKWAQLKGQVKEQWGKLTDDEIDELDGRRDQLVGKVQERYGIAREQAARDVDNWLNNTARTYYAICDLRSEISDRFLGLDRRRAFDRSASVFFLQARR